MARSAIIGSNQFASASLKGNAASLFLDDAYISAVQADELIAVTDREAAASFLAPAATAYAADVGSFAGGGEMPTPSDTGPTGALAAELVPGFDITTPSSQAAFTVGNVVVYRIGTGAAALTSAATAVFLDEFRL